jgi:tetratricopeptide (TPR) repeat protein
MGDTSKIHFNIGSLFTVLNDHKRAVRYKNSIFNTKRALKEIKKITAFNRAIANDTYFAVAHLQRGVSLFLLGDLEAAKDDFDKAYQHLRGNDLINYQQLGLHFTLYSCQGLFNRGICQLYLGNSDLGLEDLHHAQTCTQIKQHGTIDQAVGARGKGYSV